MVAMLSSFYREEFSCLNGISQKYMYLCITKMTEFLRSQRNVSWLDVVVAINLVCVELWKHVMAMPYICQDHLLFVNILRDCVRTL